MHNALCEYKCWYGNYFKHCVYSMPCLLDLIHVASGTTTVPVGHSQSHRRIVNIMLPRLGVDQVPDHEVSSGEELVWCTAAFTHI